MMMTQRLKPVSEKYGIRGNGGGVISERHGAFFESPRKRMTRRFKTNVLNRFIHYMNFTHVVSVWKESYDKNWKDVKISLQGRGSDPGG